MDQQITSFRFITPGALADGELELVLLETTPPNPVKAWLPAYIFEMRVAGRRVGGLNLRIGTTPDIEAYYGHVGYAVDAAHRGHHYAERACRLILPIAKAHGMDVVWITCNPDNTASRRTCERLGAELVNIVDLPEDNDLYRQGDRQSCRYKIEL